MGTPPRLFLVCAGLAAGLLGSRTAWSWERATVTDDPNTLLFWPTRTLTYYVSGEGYSGLPLNELVGAVRRSFDTWSAPSCTDISFIYGGLTDRIETNFTREPDEHPDYRNVVRWRENGWPPGDATIQGASSSDTDPIPQAPDPSELDSVVTADQLALTLLVYSIRTGKIFDADIEVNGTFFEWSAGDQPTAGTADVQNVLTHEVGHLLGLAHSNEFDSTMYAYQDVGETSRRELQQDDIDGLCALYPFDAVTQLGPGQTEADLQLYGRGCNLPPNSSSNELFILLVTSLLLAARRRRATDSGQPRAKPGS